MVWHAINYNTLGVNLVLGSKVILLHVFVNRRNMFHNLNYRQIFFTEIKSIL